MCAVAHVTPSPINRKDRRGPEAVMVPMGTLVLKSEDHGNHKVPHAELRMKIKSIITQKPSTSAFGRGL